MESTAIESGVERVAREREFRRRWYEAHVTASLADRATVSTGKANIELEGFGRCSRSARTAR